MAVKLATCTRHTRLVHLYGHCSHRRTQLVSVAQSSLHYSTDSWPSCTSTPQPVTLPIVLHISFLRHKYTTCHHPDQQDVPAFAGALPSVQGMHPAGDVHDCHLDLEAEGRGDPLDSASLATGDNIVAARAHGAADRSLHISESSES